MSYEEKDKSGRKSIRRGYLPEDTRQFSASEIERLKRAAIETAFLLDRGYDTKQVTTFVGNHYMFSERQRLALARSISPSQQTALRKEKQIKAEPAFCRNKVVHIDGFNTIITLEVALSGSPVLCCMDGTIRDLAGLRGTYHIIDKTETAVRLILEFLDQQEIKEAHFYLDAPVSNSGRLKSLVMDTAGSYRVKVVTDVINDVDRILEQKENVITSDAIILNKCSSWINLSAEVIANLDNVWKITLF